MSYQTFCTMRLKHFLTYPLKPKANTKLKDWQDKEAIPLLVKNMPKGAVKVTLKSFGTLDNMLKMETLFKTNILKT